MHHTCQHVEETCHVQAARATFISGKKCSSTVLFEAPYNVLSIG